MDESRPEPVDLYPERRPGYPREWSARPAQGTHWEEPQLQPLKGKVFRRTRREGLTPVFGTAQPARGLSGLLRRTAYSSPESLTRHWLLLLLADRVDSLGHRLSKPSTWAAAGMLAGGMWLVQRSVPKGA